MRLQVAVIAVAIALQLGCSASSDSSAKQEPTEANALNRREIDSQNEPTTDADRVADVHAIASLVEEFKQKTGHYPYEEAFLNPEPGFVPVSAAVIVTSQDLPEQYRYPPPGVSGAVYPCDEFIAYLSEALKRKVTLPSDSEPPPRFYQYQFDGQNYYVSATLSQPTAHTRQLAPNWHKYQVGSTAIPEKKVLRFSEIK
jgi:hypothetical protein